MSSVNISALALIGSTELRADPTQLSLLEASVIEQMRLMRRLRGEESLRGLLVALMLHRVKASMPYGTFGAWIKSHIAEFGDRYVNYLMRLALAFVGKSKVSKPELLALPGDQVELAIDGMEGQQRRFLEKALKFVGTKSLHELFEAHGIKSTKKLGGARTPAADGEPVILLDAEQLYVLARDEIGGAIDRAEGLLLRENRLQFMIGHAEEIQGVVISLRELATKVAAAAKPLLLVAKPETD